MLQVRPRHSSPTLNFPPLSPPPQEVSLFLMQPQTLDPSAAVGLYVKLGAGEWLYRGCVHNGHPTEVMPLQVGGGGGRDAPQLLT